MKSLGNLIGLTFLSALLVCTPSMVYAYEPHVKSVPVKVIHLSSGDTHEGAYSGNVKLGRSDGRDALKISIPITLGNYCGNDEQPIMLLDLHTSKSMLRPKDWIGRTHFKIGMNPELGRFFAKVTSYPTIEGYRAAKPIAYIMPFMDETPFRFCSALDSSSGAYDQPFMVHIFLAPHSVYVSMSRVGAPFAPVFNSTLSIGPGPAIEDGMSITGKVPMPLHTSRNIAVSALYWRRDMSDGMAQATLSNFMNDLNLNYGAKSYPVRKPFLEAGRAATSLFVAITN